MSIANFGGGAERNFPVWNVAGHHAACTDHCVPADSCARKQAGSDANEASLTDRDGPSQATLRGNMHHVAKLAIMINGGTSVNHHEVSNYGAYVDHCARHHRHTVAHRGVSGHDCVRTDGVDKRVAETRARLGQFLSKPVVPECDKRQMHTLIAQNAQVVIARDDRRAKDRFCRGSSDTSHDVIP